MNMDLRKIALLVFVGLLPSLSYAQEAECQNMAAADQQDEQEVGNMVAGYQFLALIEAYQLNISACLKKNDGGVSADFSAKVLNFLCYLMANVLAESNHPEAHNNLKQLIERVTKQEEVNLYPAWAQGNSFSGEELFLLDWLIADGCEVAFQAKNMGALLQLLAYRESLLKESIQLLLSSTNPEAKNYQIELHARLAKCVACDRQLRKMVAEDQQQAVAQETEVAAAA